VLAGQVAAYKVSERVAAERGDQRGGRNDPACHCCVGRGTTGSHKLIQRLDFGVLG